MHIISMKKIWVLNILQHNKINPMNNKIIYKLHNSMES